MPLIDFKLSADMKAASQFHGIATDKFFLGIAKGVIKSILDVTTVTIIFTGVAGSPGSAFLQGIPVASPDGMNPIMSSNLIGKQVNGVAMTNLSSAFSQIAQDLRTDAMTKVGQVPGVANGTGVISPGGIVLSKEGSVGIIRGALINEGIHGQDGNLTQVSESIVEAIASALRYYLMTLSYTIPVVGGTPTIGTSSVTLSGGFIS